MSAISSHTARFPSILAIFTLLLFLLSSLLSVSAAPLATTSDSLHLLTDTVDTLSLASLPLPGSPISNLIPLPNSNPSSNTDSNTNHQNTKPATLLGRIYHPASTDPTAEVARSAAGSDDGEASTEKTKLTRAERFQRRVGRARALTRDELEA